MTRKFQYLLLLPLFIACSTPQFTTTNVQDMAAFDPQGLLYSLPTTRVVVKVSAARTRFFAGPYHAYAKQYLGIEGAAVEDFESWKITNIQLSKLIEPDQDHYYSVRQQKTNAFTGELERLSKDGLILLPSEGESIQSFNSTLTSSVKEIHNTDLSIKPFYLNKTRKGGQSGDFPTHSRSAKHLKLKSEAEKAKEAAAFIFKIRKRRFKLLAGQYEVFPEGTALETSVEELNELEESYLSLFVGKKETDTLSRVYTVNPEGKENLQRFTLFKFSEVEGYLSDHSNTGVPIVMEFMDMERTKVISQLDLPLSSTAYENLFFYRIPDKAKVRTFLGSHVLHEAEIQLYQFGSIVPKYVEPKCVTRKR